MPRERQEGESIMKKFCTRCGRQFESVGREVICPSCKAQAAEETKRAAVLKAKKASWSGESVPVRISGRASTVIRAYGAEKSLPFAAALDELLKSTDCFKGMSIKWDDITPYRSHRRDKHATETEDAQEVKAQEVKQDGTQTAQEVKAAKVNKTSTTAKKAIKTSASRGGKKA